MLLCSNPSSCSSCSVRFAAKAFEIHERHPRMRAEVLSMPQSDVCAIIANKPCDDPRSNRESRLM